MAAQRLWIYLAGGGVEAKMSLPLSLSALELTREVYNDPREP